MKDKILDVDPFGVEAVLSSFKNEISYLKREDLKNNIIGVVKRIIFLDLILKDSGEYPKRYSQSMIYDSLNAILSIINGNERYFYFDFRSLIENSIRSFLLLNDKDRTGINEMFENFKKLEIGNYQLIVNYYSRSCDYVHNNARASLPITNSFTELKNNISNEDLMVKRSTELLSLLSEICFIYSITHYEIVEHVFYRKKSTLKRLLSQKTFEKINKHIADTYVKV